MDFKKLSGFGRISVFTMQVSLYMTEYLKDKVIVHEIETKSNFK